MYFTVSLHLFHSLDSSISPNFRYFKSDYGQDFKTWVGKGAPGNRTSCVELLVPTPWDVNMLTTADWQAVPVRVPSCAVSLRAHVLHLGDYFCYTGVAINYVCYSPFTVGTFPFIILFLFFRGCTVWSKSHYPQHCWQREVNTSMGSHGSINLNNECRRNISGGLPATLKKKKKKKTADRRAKRKVDVLLQELEIHSWILLPGPGQLPHLFKRL